MAKSWIAFLASVVVVLAARTVARAIDETQFSPANTIVKDVVVLGGGASGSYAAVRLKDSGKTVVVVEQKNRLVCLLRMFIAGLDGARTNIAQHSRVVMSIHILTQRLELLSISVLSHILTFLASRISLRGSTCRLKQPLRRPLRTSTLTSRPVYQCSTIPLTRPL